MTLHPHEMLQDFNHDETALQDFVTSFRAHLAGKIRPGLRAVYEKRIQPAFQKKNNREPADKHEVRQEMTQDPHYQFWSALQRKSQEMRWDSVISAVEPRIEEFNQRAQRLSATPRGSLELNPDLEIPVYHTAADIHLQPGGFHSEVADNDVTAGAVYDNALPIYSNRSRGPKGDVLGQTLVQFFQKQYPDRKPGRILDMGCGIGGNTLAWAEAFPEAEIHGLDVGAPMLRYAHARAESMGIAAHFKQLNAEETDYPDQSFDLIVSHIILHETSTSALSNIFRECYRLLKPGGVMLHTDIPGASEPFDAFMMEWETMNSNENFASTFRDTDLAAVAAEVGFSRDQARMENMPRLMEAKQQAYSDRAITWPVLVGEK
jgi:ubiquinone/menaquinone biosynthesis C-methylase UbiE